MSHSTIAKRLKRKQAEMADPAILAARIKAEQADLERRLELLQATIRYTFSDRRLAVAALFATNSSNRVARQITEQSGWTQHRLAWLGDSVLRLLLTVEYAGSTNLRYANEERCKSESNAFLSQRAKATGLVELALTASGQVLSQHWPIATIVEAVVGAVFHDSKGSLQAARSVLSVLGVTQ